MAQLVAAVAQTPPGQPRRQRFLMAVLVAAVVVSSAAAFTAIKFDVFESEKPSPTDLACEEGAPRLRAAGGELVAESVTVRAGAVQDLGRLAAECSLADTRTRWPIGFGDPASHGVRAAETDSCRR
jgi:hypothetical protein